MDSPEGPTKSTYEDQPATDLSDVTYASKDIRTTPKASKSSWASEWLGGFAGLSLAFVVESVVNMDQISGVRETSCKSDHNCPGTGMMCPFTIFKQTGRMDVPKTSDGHIASERSDTI